MFLAARGRWSFGETMRRPENDFLARAAIFILFLLTPVMALSAQIQPPPVDQTSANRGQDVYSANCAQCHGSDVRGTDKGLDLIRSLAVLHDRAQQLHGSELAPLLKKQPDHNFDLTQDQIADLSQFLTRAVNKILRSGYSNQPTDMLSGDPKAGEAFFNGNGGCTKCHSVTGDLAGIGAKYEPAALQQRFVFPSAGGIGGRGRGAAAGLSSSRPKAQVTVTPASGPAITGTLIRIDDFTVTLQDSSGADRTFTRESGMKVDVNDPYAAHVALLDKYTDADIHNLTAYLETLK
jgi:cytochrome c oxidase cbb3-type subunit III